jgi:hypothetical protein
LTERGNWAAAAELTARIPNNVRSRGIQLDPARELQLELDTALSHFRAHADEAAAGTSANTDKLTRARTSMDRAMAIVETAKQIPAGVEVDITEVYRRGVQIESWAEDFKAGVRIASRGAKAFPAATELLQVVLDAAGNEPALATTAYQSLTQPNDPPGHRALIQWYLGRGRFATANQARQTGKFDAATSEFQKAEQCFQTAKQQNPDFADSSDQWSCLCKVGQAAVLRAQSKYDEAMVLALDALKTRPDIRANEIDEGISAKSELLRLGGYFYQKGELTVAEKLFREATALAADDLDFANNHGLFARDLGTRTRNPMDANDLFKASYASYLRAAHLAPDDPRQLNDCALVMIYHVGTDLDGAETQLTKAIQLAERQLAEAPPADAQELASLQEALGDCYENLGYLYIEHRPKLDPKKARAALEKAKAFPPAPRAAVQRLMRKVERLEQGAAGTGDKLEADRDGEEVR